MKLYAYKINGVPVNQLETYEDFELNGYDPYIVDDTLPVGYEDISSIQNWASIGMSTGKDYKFVRKEIYTLVVTNGWSSLSTEEKQIAAQWFVVGKTERDEVYTTTEQIQLGIQFHENSIECRKTRSKLAMMEVYNKLNTTDINNIIDEIANGHLIYKYIEFGEEGTLEGDNEGLFDYIQARIGTSYETTGLKVKSITPLEGTLQNLVDNIMNILNNGV